MTLRMTLRGKLLVTLPIVLSGSLYAGHIFSATPYIPAEVNEIPCLAEPKCAQLADALIPSALGELTYHEGIAVLTPSIPPTDDRQDIVIYEDGSGVQYAPGTNREIRTFPEDTFAWDCATMGNGICGPTR